MNLCSHPLVLMNMKMLFVALGMTLASGCSDARHSGLDLHNAVFIGNHEEFDAGTYYDLSTGNEIPGEMAFVPKDFRRMHLLSRLFSDGLMVVREKKNGLYQYINPQGEMKNDMQFAEAAPFFEGIAVVAIADLSGRLMYGMIDESGKWIVPPGTYQAFGPMSDGRCAFRVGDKWGLLDRQGRVACPPTFNIPPVFQGGRAMAGKMDGKIVYIDRSGSAVFHAPDGAVQAKAMREGRSWYLWRSTDVDDQATPDLFSEYKYGLLSSDGKTISPPVYEQVGSFSEGMAAVSFDSVNSYADDNEPGGITWENEKGQDQWGYINPDGYIVIPVKFQRAGPFSGGLARVMWNGKWGYIDKKGNWAIKPRFVWAGNFHDGLAEVWNEKHVLIINNKGHVVFKTNLEPFWF